MADLVTKVLRAREAGAVKRLHTLPIIGEYKVDQHCYGMLVLLDLLYPKPAPEGLHSEEYAFEYIELVRHILYHDTHERYTGDVPNGLRHINWKREEVNPDMFKNLQKGVDIALGYLPGWGEDDLSEHQRNWFKSLDRLEFLLTCYDQRALGNKNIEPCIEYEEKWFATSDIVPLEVRKFVEDFEWRRTSNEL